MSDRLAPVGRERPLIFRRGMLFLLLAAPKGRVGHPTAIAGSGFGEVPHQETTRLVAHPGSPFAEPVDGRQGCPLSRAMAAMQLADFDFALPPSLVASIWRK